jgi:hypothetical protein
MASTRFIIGFIYGTFLGLFGVFLFSNFIYAGISISEVFSSTNISASLYQFFWLSFRFNLFDLFDPAVLSSINLLETFYPAFMGWFSAGLVAGIIVKGVKRSIINALLMVVFNVILWLSFAMISGANLTFVFFTNLYETGGGILLGLGSAILGGSIGGLLSGRYSS